MVNVINIAADPGHGGDDHGAFNNGIVEAQLNLQVCRIFKHDLETLHPNFRVHILRDDTEDPSFKERARRAKERGCRLVWCIHTNAAPNTAWHGALGFHMPGDVQAKKMINTVLRCSPSPLHKPGWSAYSVDDTHPDDKWLQRPRNCIEQYDPELMDAALYEIGYCSNKKDAEALQLGTIQAQISIALIQGTLRWARSF